MTQPHITPFLWFDSNAEEAVDFYVSVFKNAKKTSTLNGPNGKPITVGFELGGLQFTAMNGGPGHPFTDATSFVVHCENQAEIDDYWSKLTADGGREIECGWLRDKFGLSWQIIPRHIFQLLKHPKAFQAMMQMKKLDIATLENAAKS